MPTFHYKAISATGEVIEGLREAPGEAGVVAWLQDAGYMPLQAQAADGAAAPGWLSRDLFAGRKLSRKGQLLVIRELSTLLGAGLPLDRAFEILIDLSKQRSLRDLLRRVLEAVRGGATLADALAEQEGQFSALTINLVRAGEAGGALETVLARLAEHLEKAQVLAETLRSALIYPAILLAMVGFSIVILMTVVIPEFQALFADAGDALPFATRVVIGTAELFTETWWLMAAVALAGTWLLRRKLRDERFRVLWDRMKLGLPLFGDLAAKVEIARLTRTLGTLTQNGVPLLKALSIARQVLGNAALARALDQVAASLREGKGLAQPLAESGLFPDLAAHLIRVGEETGELEPMLSKIAGLYDREVQTAIERMVAVLVPALTIGLGLVVATIIGSVMLAFLSVNELAL